MARGPSWVLPGGRPSVSRAEGAPSPHRSPSEFCARELREGPLFPELKFWTGRQQRWDSASRVPHACPTPVHAAFSWELRFQMESGRGRKLRALPADGGVCPGHPRGPARCPPLGGLQGAMPWVTVSRDSNTCPLGGKHQPSGGTIPLGPRPLAPRVLLGKGLHVLWCPGHAPPSAQLTPRGLSVPQKHGAVPADRHCSHVRQGSLCFAEVRTLG